MGDKMKRTSLALAALLALALPAAAQNAQFPIPPFTGPNDPSQLRAYLNTLVSEINAVLGPVVPAQPGSTNLITLGGTPTGGGNPAISLTTTSDGNAGIAIQPNGRGNIVLFDPGVAGAGLLQFADTASFAPATGLAACPGMPTIAKKTNFGVDDHVDGYFIVQDWLGRSHGMPAC
jgi:hypothetical protein